MCPKARLKVFAGTEERSDQLMTSSPSITVLVYSQHPEVRADVRSAVGRRAAGELGRINWVECSNYSQLRNELDGGDVDLAILDGDAQPTGGIGLCRQFKNEITDCPPIIVLLLRTQDRWLAAWSQADAVIVRPIDPVTAAATVGETLRTHAAAIPVIR
jgi:DNA-binding response OmpR family regulator